ncbi:MAG TPA: NADH dehydrogenase subunit, partial [Bacteroidales bacterium]|nr:NADH dehydrogenase subunit [Bacteroidales bacterium]
IAMHIGDTAGLCTDIAYQFGQVVNEALRTIVINTTQFWCGNRFGKGLIRPLGNHYPLNAEIIQKIRDNLEEVKERYLQITDRMFTMPSVLSRFEGIGRVSAQQALLTGAVGMAARSANLKRDIRWSHPFQYYKNLAYEPVLFSKGDVWSRAKLREKEVEQSIAVINQLLDFIKNENLIETPVQELNLQPGTFAISLTEGWRGEICHAAITDEKGKIVYYKVKDPSLHNWMSLALALRGVEISDFPINNKSFNLSYCGHDL